MTSIFTIFLAQFISPIPIVVGIAAAFVSRAWWNVGVTAVTATLIGEYFTRMENPEHSFSPLVFATGVLAAAIWAAWFYWIRLTRKKGE